jgi:hypothetical protein
MLLQWIIERQKPLEFANEADVALIGSGIKTREISIDNEILSKLHLEPSRQLIGAQCPGALLLAKLGLIGPQSNCNLPACTDLTSKHWIIEAGVPILDAPFVAHGNCVLGNC